MVRFDGMHDDQPLTLVVAYVDRYFYLLDIQKPTLMVTMDVTFAGTNQNNATLDWVMVDCRHDLVKLDEKGT
jgi:hypothetical protein